MASSAATLHVDGLVCDLDGVVYRGSEPIPQAVETLRRLHAGGMKIIFATNNATATVDSYHDRLSRIGLSVEAEDIVTSAVVTAEEMVLRGWTGRSVFLIGSDGIRDALVTSGMTLTEGAEGRTADIVVVSSDPNFTYDAMRTATYAVRNGATLLATNEDPTFPVSDGIWPGAGALLASVEVASGKKAEVMGKPHRPMMEAADRRLGPRQRVAIVGDQAMTDLAGGRAMGWTTILVLSGVTDDTAAAALSPRPDIIVPSIASLVPLLLPD